MKRIDELFTVEKEIEIQGRKIRIYARRGKEVAKPEVDTTSDSFGGEYNDTGSKKL